MDRDSDMFCDQDDSKKEDEISECPDDARGIDSFRRPSEGNSGVSYELEDDTFGVLNSADGETKVLAFFEQEHLAPANRFHTSRRHSLGDSSAIVRPLPQRRCSFQTLSTNHWENAVREGDLQRQNEATHGSQSCVRSVESKEENKISETSDNAGGEPSEGNNGISCELEDDTFVGLNSADGETGVLDFFEQEHLAAAHRFHTSRRHSLGDSSAIVRPLSQRRCSFQTLSTNHWENGVREGGLHRQNEATHGSQSSVCSVGSQLFLAFLQEEISRSHLLAPGCLYDIVGRPSSRRGSLQPEEFVSIGQQLRNMADQFAISDQRQRVRERAEDVPLENLDVTSFTDLLVGMFQQGGITCERVLVLFVFCTDLALRALRAHLLPLFADVTRWSQQYIESWVSPLVQRHGGWSVVLEQTVHEVYKAAVIGACVMSMVALWTYIRTAGH